MRFRSTTWMLGDLGTTTVLDGSCFIRLGLFGLDLLLDRLLLIDRRFGFDRCGLRDPALLPELLGVLFIVLTCTFRVARTVSGKSGRDGESREGGGSGGTDNILRLDRDAALHRVKGLFEPTHPVQSFRFPMRCNMVEASG